MLPRPSVRPALIGLVAALLTLLLPSNSFAQSGAQVSIRSSTGSTGSARGKPFTLTADAAFDPGCSAGNAAFVWTVDGAIVESHGRELVLQFNQNGSHVVGVQVAADKAGGGQCTGGVTTQVCISDGGQPCGGGGTISPSIVPLFNRGCTHWLDLYMLDWGTQIL